MKIKNSWMMKKIIFLTIIISFTCSMINAQPLEKMKHTLITQRDGLPSANIATVFQDSKGFIWIGADNYPLYRYDGYSFKEILFNLLDTTITYPSNTVLCIYEDKDGIFWIGTIDGLFKFDPEKSQNVTIKYPFPLAGNRYPAAIYTIYEDTKGNLWLGTANGNNLPVFNKRNKTYRMLRLDPDQPDSMANETFSAQSIIADDEQNIWLGTARGLYKYDVKKDTFTVYRILPDFKYNYRNYISSVCPGDTNTIWIGSTAGLFLFDSKREKFTFQFFEPSKNPDPYSYSVKLENDHSDNIWFRSAKGLYRIIPGEKKYHIKKVFSYDIPVQWYNRSLCFDESGNIWFGTYREGLNILTIDQKPFKTIKYSPDNLQVPRFNPFCVLEDNKGIVWVGSIDGKGLYQYNKVTNKFKHYQYDPSDPNSISQGNVNCIYQDHRGTLWIGTEEGGLNKAVITGENRVQFKHYLPDPNDPSSLREIRVFEIFEDADSNLWIHNGSPFLSKYDRENDAFAHLFLGSNYINYTNADPVDSIEVEGTLWFPHWMGISRIIPPVIQRDSFTLEPKKIIGYPINLSDPLSIKTVGMSNTHCFSSYYQPGTLWFGTYGGGLGRMTRKARGVNNNPYVQFKFYTSEDGLSGNIIFGILEDNSGNLWISTDNGLSKFDPRSELFTSFYFDDVFSSDAFIGYQPFKNKEGLMYFVHEEGILYFHPDSIQVNEKPPRVYLTDFKISGKSVEVGNDSPLQKTISYAKKIKLKHSQNNLSFEFVTLDYNNPERNQYRYILEGLEEEWTQAGDGRTAYYPNLGHDRYIFRVQGSNSMGVWNTEGTSLEITIRPPWWQTIVAYISYVVLAFLIVTVYIQIHTRRLKKEKDELERLVQERTHQLQEANEELLQQKEEIQTTLDHLQQTQEQLIVSEKMAALGGLVAGVAHEINTPVGITITAASNLKEETDKMAKLYKENKISRAQFMEYMNASNQSVNLILSNMERTATMIQSFKQVSVDQSTEQKRAFKLKSYTEDVIRSLYPKLKKKKIHINLEIDEELEIDSYPGAYSQIITNLVLNSITHGFEEKQKGKIDVKVLNENGELIMEYKDNGKGISKENQKRIYDPFFTTNKKIGTGLGMHIVYNLVTQKLRGSIECITSPDQGVMFKMQIPI